MATHASSDHDSIEHGKRQPAPESAQPTSAVPTPALPQLSALHPPPGRGNGPHHAAQVAHLQRAVGNRATRRLVQPTRSPAPHADSPAPGPLPMVQRTITVGGQWIRLRRGMAVMETDGPLPPAEANAGTGDRNVMNMVRDNPKRHFLSKAELLGYAARSAAQDNIGYVARAKTWVRVPGFMVVGESHGGTTMEDLAAATGTRRYKYEPRSAPSQLMHPTQSRVASRENVVEESLPKMAVGLAGVAEKLAPIVKDYSDNINNVAGNPLVTRRELKSMWKDQMRQDQQAALQAPKVTGTYNREFAKWTREMEDIHTRTGSYFKPARNGAGHLEMAKEAPDKDYDRTAKEASITLGALKALQANQLGWRHPLRVFYRDHKSIINETVTQLEGGVPVEKTRMAMKMATNKFNLTRLITLYTQAAEGEMRQRGVADVSQDPRYQYLNTETAAAGQRAENFRDSYMMHNIRAAQAAGQLLVGVGDLHRQNLETILDAEGIRHTTMDEFIAQQSDAHNG